MESGAPPHHSFGTLLRRYRLAAGFTQEELAERAGISCRSIGDLERGVQRTPHRDTIALLIASLCLAPRDRDALAAAGRRLGRSAASYSDATPAIARSTITASAAPFVGRVHELALLEYHLAPAAHRSAPPVLLLAGEPGIGKSRLLQIAAGRGERGWCVLSGGCGRRGGQEPYAPLLTALERHLQPQSEAQRRASLQDCAWLARLLPELMGPEALPALELEQERRLIYKAVTRVLANVAGPAGTLLLLDDLQWASADALDLLAALARTAAEIPLRIVGAYRDTEIGPDVPLATALADLAHAGLVTHQSLVPLAPAEAGQLLDALLDGREGESTGGFVRDQVLQRTGGVPFFLVSYAQELRAGLPKLGASWPSAGAEDAVPWTVAQSIRQRVAVLPESARRVLGAAAVVGRNVELTLLTVVTAQPEDDVVSALESASQSGLLVEEEPGYRFAHDVIREVVEAGLGAARRTVLHRQVAEALEHEPRGGRPELPVEVLAYHYYQGGLGDKAALYLEQAGERAQARYAHAAAESYYRQAMAHWDRLGQPLEAARVRRKLGATLHLLARYDQAIEILEKAAEAYRASGDRTVLALVVADIGELYVYRGTAEAGLRWLEPQMSALLEATDDTPAWRQATGALLQALARQYLELGRHGEALPLTVRVVELARAEGAGGTLATALYRHGFVLRDLVGRTEEVRQIAEETRRVAEVAGDLNSLHWALHQSGCVYSLRGEWAAAQAYADRALEVAERRGDPGPMVDLLVAQGNLAFYRGDWTQARRRFERAQQIGGEISASYVTEFADLVLATLGRLAMAEGNGVVARDLCEEAVAAARASGRVSGQRWAQCVLAELDLRTEHAEAAYARLVPLLDHPGLEMREVTPLLVMMAWALLEQGENQRARQTVAQAIARLRRDCDRVGLVDALRVQALAQIACGHWGKAVASLREGLALGGAMPYPYGEARLLQGYAALHARKGERALARERLGAALAIFQRLGARYDVEETAQALTAVP